MPNNPNQNPGQQTPGQGQYGSSSKPNQPGQQSADAERERKEREERERNKKGAGSDQYD